MSATVNINKGQIKNILNSKMNLFKFYSPIAENLKFHFLHRALHKSTNCSIFQIIISNTKIKYKSSEKPNLSIWIEEKADTDANPHTQRDKRDKSFA